ncbi:MAG: sulfotransferase [Opitutales bacterium]
MSPELPVALVNDGLYHQPAEPPPPPDRRTILIVGPGRGGTSMVAGSLYRLGLPLGLKHSAYTFEDVPLSRAFEAGDWKQVRALVEERNGRWPAWAWKRPTIMRHRRRVEQLFRGIRYVFVFRDPLAVALRRSIAQSGKYPVARYLNEAVRDYERMVRYLDRTSFPVLAVSYEKALLDPPRFVDALAAFAGCGDEEQRVAAVAAIRPNDPGYLQGARRYKSQGSFRILDAQRLVGKARLVTRDGDREVLTVRLLVNDTVRAETRTVLEAGRLPETGDALPPNHFVFRLEAVDALQPGDRVNVQVKGDAFPLEAEPETWEPA